MAIKHGIWMVVLVFVLLSGCGGESENGNTLPGEPENTEAACQDGVDNDEDGATDLDDAECAAYMPTVIIEVPSAIAEPIEFGGLNGLAQNPIVSHIFTADPSANVFEGRIYVVASHDLDDQTEYLMKDYHIFSSDDLVNWQDHGVVLNALNIPWAGLLYAPDMAYSEVTGKYYLYFPNGANGVGVAVSDTPYGPFEDALGEPLVDRTTPGVEDVEWIFDPTCFVDDDGQVYLYFGGGMANPGTDLRVIRLGEDMISLADESATSIDAPDFFEAAFLHKRNGTYYLSYSTSFENHSAEIDYLVSNDPMTGFEHAGTVLPNPQYDNGNNNHHSIVEFEGEWYIFYHNRILSNELGLTDYQRSITLDHLSYDADGNIEFVSATKGDVAQLKPMDGHSRMEAETMAAQGGIETDFVVVDGSNAGVAVTDIHDQDWIGYSQVDFGEEANEFTAMVASNLSAGAKIHLFIDGADLFADIKGEQIATCTVSTTGGLQNWSAIECGITPTSGIHDLYLRFEGPKDQLLLSIDYFQFE